jgi:hypothetical protein
MNVEYKQKKQHAKKRRNKFLWIPLLFSLAFAFGFFGYNSFWADISSESAQKTHEIFVATLADKAPAINDFPAPRVLKFHNARGYDTLRVIIITDYSASKTEVCATYHVAFSKEQRQECFPKTKINFEDRQALVE